MNAIAVIRAKETGSLNMIIPKIAVPAAPIPVQTAYAVPIGSTFNDQLNREKLPAAKTMKPRLGQSFVNPLESFWHRCKTNFKYTCCYNCYPCHLSIPSFS